MTHKITDELRQALAAHGGRPVRVEDDQTQQVYVLVDERTHEQSMRALRLHEDRAAIQAGIDDMEAGRVVPLKEVDARIRQKLGMPPRG